MDADAVGRLVQRAAAGGDPVAWFDPLYRAAGGDPGAVPWARGAPDPLLVGALERLAPAPGRAVVVGCGLGDDAEELARRGFVVVAFDVAPTAVAWARRRHPASPVDYRVADLLGLPAELRGAFDLVAEVRTLQSLPARVRRDATRGLVRLLAPGATLILVAEGAPVGERLPGPPWPLVPADLRHLERQGLTRAEPLGRHRGRGRAGVETWVAAWRRPAD